MAHFRTLTEISFELARRIPPLHQQGPIFFLAQTEKEAQLLFTLCRYWNASFPGSVIVSDVFLKEHTLTKKEFEHQVITLKTGVTLPRSTLAERLIALGFERTPRAVAERTIAVRGDVVDIIDRQAFRVEYDGNSIQSIKRFNPSTQSSTQTISEAKIWPMAYASHLPLWHEQDLEFEFITPRYYHRRFALLKHDAERFLTIRVATNHPEEIRTLLPNATITPFLRGLEGFIFPKEHNLFLTDEHFFEEETVVETFERPLDPNEIEAGDYIVHIDHGIGVFERITTIDGEPYFALRYLNNDKLYVPLGSANRLEKYIGGAKPQLTSLSGTHWEQAVQKVREDVRETAKELLRMHARHASAKTIPIPATLESEELSCAKEADFELTPDQIQAFEDIVNDLNAAAPMDRLLCGDVGFGKTEVALRTAFHAVLHGGQVALVAPTTVLAEQHAHTFSDRLNHFGVSVGLLSRLQSPAEQKRIIGDLRGGKIDICIGTHRLLSGDIAIPKLNFLIIDEEQRFGVIHKERLKNLRESVHVLTMTATPIPRTLNLALSGLRDISVLNTAPPQRLGITIIIEEYHQKIVHDAIAEELKRGGQVYVVHNDIATLYSRLRVLAQHFPRAHCALVHGQLPPAEIINVMRHFHEGEIDVLVASTIIENGLDITNANTLIVEHAEQFGLAQLYQLRGRIGRGMRKAYAYFLYAPDRLSRQGQERLRALQRVKELGGGFELAMHDLEIRGVGDILGKRQHGHVQQIGLSLYMRLLNQAIVQLQETPAQT